MNTPSTLRALSTLALAATIGLCAIALAASFHPSAAHAGQPVEHPAPAPSPAPAAAATPSTSPAPVLAVSGIGEVQRKPDFAIVLVGIEVREPTAAKASERAGKSIEAVTKAISDLRLSAMTLQTSSVSLSPAYTWLRDTTGNDGDRRKLVGYDATSIIRVKVEDPRSVGRIMDAAIAAGANRIDGVTFELKAALEASNEAITLAAKAARQKADTLAAALGMSIEAVIEATTSNVEEGWRQPMSQMTSNLAAPASPAPDGLGSSIEPGMVTVKAEVSVRYRAK